MRVTTTWRSPASASARAAMWTPIPPTSSARSSTSPVWIAARIVEARAARARPGAPNAQRSARVGASNVARMPSPVVLTSWPCQRSTSARATSSWRSRSLAPAPVAERRGATGGVDDVGEQHGRQHAIRVLRGVQRLDLLLGPGVRGRVTRRRARRPPARSTGARRRSGTDARSRGGGGCVSTSSRKSRLPLPRMTGKRRIRYSSIRSAGHQRRGEVRAAVDRRCRRPVRSFRPTTSVSTSPRRIVVFVQSTPRQRSSTRRTSASR